MSIIDLLIAVAIIIAFVCVCVKCAKKSIRVENIEYRLAEVAEQLRYYAKLANETNDKQAEACYRYRLDQLRLRYRELEEEKERLTNDK